MGRRRFREMANLHAAETGGDKERLAEWVRMPRGTRARLKGDSGRAQPAAAVDPLLSFPISPATGGEHQKATVGATGGMRHERSSRASTDRRLNVLARIDVVII